MPGRGYPVPTSVSSKTTNQPTFGGNAKAGIPSRVGLSVFPRLAIVNGASGHNAPQFAGPNYPVAFKAGRVSRLWPVSNTNQLSGVGAPRWGMTRAPADGVNLAYRAYMQRYVDSHNGHFMFPHYPHNHPLTCDQCIANCKTAHPLFTRHKCDKWCANGTIAKVCP